jgi:hypothetical protein
MIDTIAGAPPVASRNHRRTPEFPIGDPVPTAWREDVLTRAKELDSRRAWPPRAATAATPGRSACGPRSPARPSGGP